MTTSRIRVSESTRRWVISLTQSRDTFLCDLPFRTLFYYWFDTGLYLMVLWCCCLHLCTRRKAWYLTQLYYNTLENDMKIVITNVMSFVQNCVYDRYASSIPQGERYEGFIRHLFLAPRALSSHIVSATPTLSIAVGINYYPGDNAAVCCITIVQCHPWQVLLFLSSRSW